VGANLNFNVWAPAATSATVQCNGVNTVLAKSGDAWTGVVSGTSCPAGSKYNLLLNGNLVRIDPLARDILADGSMSVVQEPYTFQNPQVWIPKEKVVIYEMHINSFSPTGDFAGAIQKLSYLQNLGVTYLELMPVFFFCGTPQGWGYNPCAPWAVMPTYGGSVGLKQFVDAANKLGMGVMLDIVFNHFDATNYLNNWDGQDEYFFTDQFGPTPWGPRPAYTTQYVRENFLVGNTQMFMDEYHISGFRWDSTICIRKGGGTGNCWDSGALDVPDGYLLLQQGNEAAHAAPHPNTFTVAEDNMNWWAITEPVSSGGAGFDGQWVTLFSTAS
jgi:1,4-alpha-glucan branching enzyme